MQTFLDPSPLRGKTFTVYACAGLRSEAERGAIGHESPFAFAASTSTGSPTTEARQTREMRVLSDDYSRYWDLGFSLGPVSSHQIRYAKLFSIFLKRRMPNQTKNAVTTALATKPGR
jgi:hypothetical protein